MKNSFLIAFLTFASVTNFAFCGKKGSANSTNPQNNERNNNDTMSSKIGITIGLGTYTATLSDSPAATAFKALLPMTINMVELNGNEKYFDLPESLPVNASRPSSIQTGDLMLYGSRTLVLFYQSFSTSYSYTKLGRIDDPKGLAEAVGSGNVKITFQLE